MGFYVLQTCGVDDAVFADAYKGGLTKLLFQGGQGLPALVDLGFLVEKCLAVGGVHIVDALQGQMKLPLLLVAHQHKAVLPDVGNEGLQPGIQDGTAEDHLCLSQCGVLLYGEFHGTLLSFVVCDTIIEGVGAIDNPWAAQMP